MSDALQAQMLIGGVILVLFLVFGHGVTEGTNAAMAAFPAQRTPTFLGGCFKVLVMGAVAIFLVLLVTYILNGDKL